MKPIKVDALRDALPHVPELRPVLDLLVALSDPDPADTWSGSGELATVGDRLLPETGVAPAVAELARTEARHLESVYGAVLEAIEGLRTSDVAKASNALLDAGALEAEKQRFDRATAYASAAYRLARRDPTEAPASLALRRWGRWARSDGNLEEARQRYMEGFEIARALSDLRGAAEAAIGAGNVLEDQGRRRNAEAWYRRALEVLGDVDEPVPEQWHAYLNIHVVLRSRGEIEASRSWIDRAKESAAAASDASAAPFIENALGQLELARGRFDEADAHLRRALERAADPRSAVTIRLNLAESLLARGRILESVEHARRSEEEALSRSVVPKLPEVYRLLGRIAAADGKNDAFVFFERALEWIDELKLPDLERALTLQAYGEFEIDRGEASVGNELKDRADRIYHQLGIPEMRSPWADVHGPVPKSHESGRDGRTERSDESETERGG